MYLAWRPVAPNASHDYFDRDCRFPYRELRLTRHVAGDSEEQEHEEFTESRPVKGYKPADGHYGEPLVDRDGKSITVPVSPVTLK